MQHSDRFDVRVIHLTKDPRAFVYSVTKRELPRASRKVLRMTGRWIVENAIMSQLCRSSFDGKHVMHLKYEDLAAHPNDTMDAAFQWLGLSSKQSVRDYRGKTQHAVSGNKMRWEETDIYFDEAWKSQLPASYRQFVWALAGLYASFYGY
jgi:hypothetical protein